MTVAPGLLLWTSSVDDGTFATAPVVIATTDMPEGTLIQRTSVAVVQWPVGAIPTGAFSSVAGIAGRITRVLTFAGEAIVPGRLTSAGSPGLDVRITPGKRAFSFRVNDASGIADLISPNARVDILLVFDNGQRGRIAKLFMENMRVLAIGSIPGRSSDGSLAHHVVCTVEVTPAEAERLAIAVTQGAIHLMLRGYGEPDVDQAWHYATPSITRRTVPPRIKASNGASP